MEPVDYKAILMKYIQLVIQYEGVSYIHAAQTAAGADIRFTEAELILLEQASEESRAIYET